MSAASSFIGGEVPRHRLNFAVDHGPRHLRGLYRCVRDGGIGFATGEPGAKKNLAGVAIGIGIATLAVNIVSWLWGS